MVNLSDFRVGLKALSSAVCISLLMQPLALMGQAVTEETQSDESIHKGSTLLGSYFNFSFATVDKTRINRIDTKSDVMRIGFNVTTGKMLSEHWGVLVSVGYLKSSTTTPITFAIRIWCNRHSP